MDEGKKEVEGVDAGVGSGKKPGKPIWVDGKVVAYEVELPLMANNILEEVYYNEWKFCGCGEPSTILRMVYDYLKPLAEREEGASGHDWLIPYRLHDDRFGIDSELHLTVMYLSDAADLTEHGGSVFGSWITPKGIRFVEVFEGMSEYQLKEF